jgi:glucosamine kinase
VVCGGFAGAARPEAAAFYRDSLKELLPAATIIVETDAFVAYVGALGLEPGVLLIAGTGSIALGRTRNGEMVRVGGWGPFFGDEGSGYWIGREAIRTALRANDAGEMPEFVRSISQALAVETITDAVSAWATGKIGVPAVAALATELIRQYPHAPGQRILTQAASHLRELVETAAKRIGASDCAMSVVGSVGSSAVMQRLIGLPFTPPRNSPERGAIIWARAF